MTISQTITDLPTPPSRADSSTFDTRADAFLAALDDLASEINTWAGEANSTATTVNTNSSIASTAATQALSAANATTWVSGTTYALHDIVVSPSNNKFYIRIVAGAGTTDPSADATNWEQTGPLDGTAINMQDNLLSRAILKDTAEELVAHGAMGATETFDCTNGNVHTATADATVTITFSNPPPTGDAGYLIIFLTNGGSQTITWPTSVDWPAGTAPTLTSAGLDILTFVTYDAGTTWLAGNPTLDVK